MKAAVLGFAAGTRWLARGWRLFRVAPLAWLALVVAYLFAMLIINLVPLVGPVASLVLIPGLSVGFMAAARSCERGQAPQLPQLFEPLRDHPRELLALGAGYALAIAVVLAASALADGGALARWLVTGRSPPAEVLGTDAFLAALVAAGALYVPVLMLWWYAPVLCAWHRTPPARALFYSFFACLLNWRAFFGYGAALALVTIAVPSAVLTALALVAGEAGRAHIGPLVFGVVILVMPTLLASFYASYRDVFGAAEAGAA